MRKEVPLLRYVFVLLFFLLGGVLLFRLPALQPESPLARQARADLVGMTGQVRDVYINEAGENAEAENQMLLEMGDFWAVRASYPTGYFDSTWLLDAAATDKQLESGIPAGKVTYSRANNPSPLALDPTQFTSLGPKPLQSDGCQSCYNYGHVAGRTNVIVSDPVSPTIAYLGSDGGGVWKTTNCCDQNTIWEPVTDDPLLASIAIGDLVLDPNNHNVIYAGTGDLRYGSWSFGSTGLLKSTDGGLTWEIKGADVFTLVYSQTVGSFPQYQAIGKVQVDPNNSDNVIVGTKQGIYFSYDAGDTWDGPCYTNNFLDQRQDTTGLLVRDMGSSTQIYAAIGTRGFPTPVQPDLGNTGANAVYMSTIPASGCPAAWTLLNNGWPTGTGDGNPTNDLVGRIDLAISASNPDVIYAQVADNVNSSGTRGVWRTTDGGLTWTQRATSSDFTGCGSGVGQTWYNAGLSVDPNNPDAVFLSMIDVFRSTNGADTFTNLTCGYAGEEEVHVDNHARAFVAGSSSVLMVGSDGGVYVTHNADAASPSSVTFINMNDSLNTIEFYSGDITANFATSPTPGINAGAQDNGSSTYVWAGNPGPALWQLRTGGDGMFARIEPIQGLRWYQESQNGALKVSTTGPAGSYTTASGAWSGDRLSFIMPYELDKYNCLPTGCTHMIVGTHRVWETILGAVPASSWYINSPDLTKGTLGVRSFIQQLSYAVSDGSIAIVGTLDGNVQYGFNMGQGVANSATWVNVTGNNVVLPNRPVMDVATDPNIPTVGYAAMGGFAANTPEQPGHVYQVTCNADCSQFTWLDKSGNLPDVPINSIIVNANFPYQVFAGSDWGLYYTNDISQSEPVWQKFTAGLPSVMIWDMAIDRGFTTLALFTRSRGAYVWPLPGAPDYFVSLSNDTSLTGLPGSGVVHSFVLTNVGTQADVVEVTVADGLWPTTLLTSSPVSLAVGESVTVTVQVDVPVVGVLGETDVFTVTAVSQGDPAIFASRTGTTAVTGHPALVTTGNLSGTAALGEVVTYTLSVTNTGDVADTFTLSLGTSVWNSVASATSVGPLAPGSSGTVQVMVTVGAELSDSVVVTFGSTFDPAVTADVTLMTYRQLVAAVATSGDASGSGAPGDVITYTVSITNTGNSTDTFAVSVSAGWPTAVSTSSIGPLAPGASGSVQVGVTIANYGQDVASVTFTSAVNPAVSVTVLMTTRSNVIFLPMVVRP